MTMLKSTHAPRNAVPFGRTKAPNLPRRGGFLFSMDEVACADRRALLNNSTADCEKLAEYPTQPNQKFPFTDADCQNGLRGSKYPVDKARPQSVSRQKGKRIRVLAGLGLHVASAVPSGSGRLPLREKSVYC